jgi:hypothetical protein
MSSSIPLMRSGAIAAHAMVDDADLALVKGRTWYLVTNRGKEYARSNFRGETSYMHRLILGLKRGDGIQVDHRNGNGLDNQRSNLRRSTPRFNQQNRLPTKNRTLPRGVIFERRRGHYVARAQLDGKLRHIGSYASVAEAEAAAISFRQTNMPASHSDQSHSSVESPDGLKPARFGDQNGATKVSDTDVDVIQGLYRAAMSRGEPTRGLWARIGKQFGIHPVTASRIGRGLTRGVPL